ncbi:MAG: gliding motility protein, partial [Capnocytophaga endodontalis]
MKKFILLQCFFLVAIGSTTAQQFKIRYKNTVKGDMIVVGNTVLGTTKTGNFDDLTKVNGSVDQVFVDIDNDPNTFNSSSANVKDPNPGSTCERKVKKAFLYWAASSWGWYGGKNKVDRNKFNQVKFKIGSANYQDIIGTKILDSNDAYIYVADVTDKLIGVAGTYTVANIQAVTGRSTGYAGGWTLFIVYEDLSKPARNITLFDGWEEISNTTKEIKIDGFTTVPTGPVKAKIAFAALEGDVAYYGDGLRIKTNKTSHLGVYLHPPGREYASGRGENFFKSFITDENGENFDRNPKSRNLLGIDVGIFDLPNAGNNILGNNTSSASLFASTNGDVYYPFMFAFSVEVIQPHIALEKRVYDAANNDVTNATNIAFGASLRYKIRFRNTGNDDAKDLVITDILPKSLQNNVSGISVPSGVSPSTYNPNTREIKFTVDKSLVKRGSAWQEISFGVQVANNCNDWRDPCANEVENSAFATYNGVENPVNGGIKTYSFPLAGSCGAASEAPTIFTVATDFSKCAYKETITLCQANAVLTAADGFDNYKWEKTEGANKGQKGTDRSLTVSEAGTYKVTKTKAGCATMYEIYEVKPNTAEADHPIHKMIENKQINGELYICPDTGQYYPQVYLCGANASVNLKVNVSNATNFVWQKKGNCNAKEAQRFKECPPSLESYNCTWANVHTNNGTTTQYT